jgi:LacI family transcriptional regulator
MAALISATAKSHDGLIVVAYENPVINDALRAVSTRLPVITMVSDLPHCGRKIYVGLDNRSAGRVAGELMARFLGPAGGDVIIFSGMRSFVGHEEREMGFRAVLAERFPRCGVARVLETHEQIDKAGELALAAFIDNPGIRGIYNVSAGNRAIASALRELGLGEHTVFITHELTSDRRRLLREGVLDAVIDQNPEIELTTAVETMLHYLGRIATAPTSAITPFYIYVRENA